MPARPKGCLTHVEQTMVAPVLTNHKITIAIVVANAIHMMDFCARGTWFPKNTLCDAKVNKFSLDEPIVICDSAWHKIPLLQ